MATKDKGTDETEEFELDDEDDFFSDDDELDNYEAPEQFDPVKVRKEIEESIIEQLAKGDQSSPIYTGLQKVISKKDKELLETRTTLAGVIEYVRNLAGNQANANTYVEFMREQFPNMLNEEDRKIYEDRLNRHVDKAKATYLEQQVQQMSRNQGQQQYPQQESQGDDKIQQYRKEATEKLKEFAKNMGVDPDDPNLNYGNEEEPLLVRMNAFSQSIGVAKEKAVDKGLDSVRRREKRPLAGAGSGTTGGRNGGDLLKNAALKMADQMRKGK